MSRAVRQVTRAIQKLYPRELADSSWDNTGLLLDSSEAGDQALARVLLAIDLTSGVCNEAIESKCNIIVAYHPFIFRGLKSITASDPQQKSLLRLVKNGISVYCPHTAVDAAVGGVNDWLADAITDNKSNQKSRSFLQKVEHPDREAGMGRLVDFNTPLTLDDLVAKIKANLDLKTVQVVRSVANQPISSVALCAGSGGSVIRGTSADCVFTGELSHHEMLYLQESGKYAIVCGHSNTERGFLPTLREQLKQELGNECEILLSKTDHDPIEYH